MASPIAAFAIQAIERAALARTRRYEKASKAYMQTMIDNMEDLTKDLTRIWDSTDNEETGSEQWAAYNEGRQDSEFDDEDEDFL